MFAQSKDHGAVEHVRLGANWNHEALASHIDFLRARQMTRIGLVPQPVTERQSHPLSIVNDWTLLGTKASVNFRKYDRK